MTRLLIMWLLAERPVHGYRIAKILSAPALAYWFHVEDASIYSMLRTLVKTGLARIEPEEEAGRARPRTLYRITRAGRAALRAGLEAAWRDHHPDNSPFPAALAAIDELEEPEITALAEARLAMLCARRRDLDTHAAGAPSALLARREAALLGAEIAWLESEQARQRRRDTHD